MTAFDFQGRIRIFCKKETDFEAEVLEAMTDYNQSSPTLWNHNPTVYRDRELRDVA